MGHSEETKRKISISMKGRHSSPSTEFKKGQHHSRKTEFKKGIIPYSKLHPEICQRGDKHHAWKGGRERFRCIDCNRIISYARKRCIKCNSKLKIGKNHPNWKGDKIGYAMLHIWIKKELGIPKYCNHCDNKLRKKFHWANKSGKYKRNINDWFSLCHSCHAIFDKKEKSPKKIFRFDSKYRSYGKRIVMGGGS